MRFFGVLPMRRTPADVGVDDDQRRTRDLALRCADSQVHQVQVVHVGDIEHIPMPSAETRRHVVGESQRGAAFDGDVIVVVEPDEVRQAKVAGNRGGFVADAFHQVAVAAEGVDAIVENIFVELRRQPALSHRKANGVRHALAERTGCGLDTRREAVLRVTRRLGAPLAELLELVEWQIEAGEMQHGVEQHRGMAVGEDEAVAAGPMRIARIEAQEAVPQDESQRSQSHGCTGMPRVGLLHRVHCQRANGVDAKLFELFLIRGTLDLLFFCNVDLTHRLPPFVLVPPAEAGSARKNIRVTRT